MIFCRHYRSIFNHGDVIGLQSDIEFGEITQNKGYYAVQGHSRSPILVPIENPVCDFLLVINTETDILYYTVSKLSQIIIQIWEEKTTLRF